MRERPAATDRRDPQVLERWHTAWPEALRHWGEALRLQPPVLLVDPPAAQADSLAWFDLQATTVTVNLLQVERLHLLDEPLPFLAHEIGHHVLAPADRTTAARVVARCAKGLVDQPRLAVQVANMWEDTLINDRLQRQRGLPMDAVYRPMAPPRTAVFAVWMRMYELLWSLPTGALSAGVTPELDADALLLARHSRAFARDPVGGAGGFAAILRRWLVTDQTDGRGAPAQPCAGQVGDTDEGALDAVALDDSLAAPVVDPASDPAVNPEARAAGAAPGAQAAGWSAGQGFGPSELTDLYAALGRDRDAALDWYVARAQSHLVPFPTASRPLADEEELQGWEAWDVGEDLGDVDWLATANRSAVVVPGQTTVRRQVDRDPRRERRPIPVDLDLYVDSSGSMPDPRRTVSPSVLAGAVLALSALRVGARVQVTVWASRNQVARTDGGFTRDRDGVVRTLLHYWGGGTVFPLADLARDHPRQRPTRRPGPAERPCHICVISDWGVVSMFGQGQRSELDGVAADALAAAGGGGSLVLRENEDVCERVRADAGGYRVYAVPREEDLVPFAQAFARARWGADGTAAATAASGES